MASKKTLNVSNLEALGAQRLAELLIEITTGDAAARRLLRLELAGAESPAGVGREIRKRLASIGRSRSFISWENHRKFADDLDAQRRAIAGKVAQADPREALELMWRFLDLAHAVFDRCDDSNGTFGDIFHAACAELGGIAAAAKIPPAELADQAFAALTRNDFGQYDGLIAVLAPALGPAGLDHLKQRVVALSEQPIAVPADGARKVIGWAASGPIYADQFAEISRVSTVQVALRDIADALGDVDAFIAQHDSKSRKVPVVAAEIATRLLAASRPAEALRVLDAATHRKGAWFEAEWEDARIAALDALGRGAEAQAARLSCYERVLSARHLRAYLKLLDDFDDVAAGEKALAHVQTYPSVSSALSFLIDWPSLPGAARLVIGRAGELDGRQYEVLAPAADALAVKYPLAATLLLRAMIDFALTDARSTRYGHAARHLAQCAQLAPGIEDFGAFTPHDAYLAGLRRDHGKKVSFWTLTS